jgi:hypothetical protein
MQKAKHCQGMYSIWAGIQIDIKDEHEANVNVLQHYLCIIYKLPLHQFDCIIAGPGKRERSSKSIVLIDP